jgi:hypothetical protein
MPATDTNRDDVARRAYELFLSRGGEHGHDQEDWYRAEQEVSGAANSDVTPDHRSQSAERRSAPAPTPTPAGKPARSKVAAKKS